MAEGETLHAGVFGVDECVRMKVWVLENLVHRFWPDLFDVVLIETEIFPNEVNVRIFSINYECLFTIGNL